LTRQSSGAAGDLAKLADAEPATAPALQEAQAVIARFSEIAALAPATPPSGLRGVTDDAVKALPSPAQLEATYLSLAASLAHIRELERSARVHQLGGLLDKAQIIIGVALAALVCGLLFIAWIMRSRIIHPLNLLERSLANVTDGAVNAPLWGADRQDEIGTV